MTLFADTNILVDSFKLDIYKDFLAVEHRDDALQC